jgi:hypothetical protein
MKVAIMPLNGNVAMYLISGHDIVKDATSLQFSMGKVWREFLPALLVMVVYRDYKPIQGSLGKFCAQDAYLPHLSTSKRKSQKSYFALLTSLSERESTQNGSNRHLKANNPHKNQSSWPLIKTHNKKPDLIFPCICRYLTKHNPPSSL